MKKTTKKIHKSKTVRFFAAASLLPIYELVYAYFNSGILPLPDWLNATLVLIISIIGVYLRTISKEPIK